MIENSVEKKFDEKETKEKLRVCNCVSKVRRFFNTYLELRKWVLCDPVIFFLQILSVFCTVTAIWVLKVSLAIVGAIFFVLAQVLQGSTVIRRDYSEITIKHEKEDKEKEEGIKLRNKVA